MLGNLYDRALDGERCWVRHTGWVRLESTRTVGALFRWAAVGSDCVARLAADVGLTVVVLHTIGSRVEASLAAT